MIPVIRYNTRLSQQKKWTGILDVLDLFEPLGHAWDKPEADLCPHLKGTNAKTVVPTYSTRIYYCSDRQ